MRRKNLNIELLRTFITIIDSGSYVLTAEILNLTQSTISHHIKRLEERIGKPLLKRDGRRKVITQDGELVLNYARRILQINDDFYDRFDSEQSTSLRLGMPEYFADVLLPRIFTKFHKKYQGTELEVLVKSNAKLIECTSKGETDIALVIGKSGSFSNESEIIAYESLIWLGKNILIDNDSKPIQLVVFKAPCPFRQTIMDTLDSNGMRWTIVHTARNLADMRAAISASLGISALPKMVLAPGLTPLESHSSLPELPNLEVRFIYPPGSSREALSGLTDLITSAWSLDVSSP